MSKRNEKNSLFALLSGSEDLEPKNCYLGRSHCRWRSINSDLIGNSSGIITETDRWTLWTFPEVALWVTNSARSVDVEFWYAWAIRLYRNKSNAYQQELNKQLYRIALNFLLRYELFLTFCLFCRKVIEVDKKHFTDQVIICTSLSCFHP